MRRTFEWLLGLILAEDDHAAVVGDLREEYERRVRRRRSNLGARLWYLRELLSALTYAVTDRARGYFGQPSEGRGLHGMRADVVFAARLFKRQPGPFLMTIAGLAVAIGLSAGVFSVAKAVAFSSLGISYPESVFRVALTGGAPAPLTGDSGFSGSWPHSSFATVAPAASSIALTASAYAGADFGTTRDGLVEPVRVGAVSGNFFSVLGLGVSPGRPLTAGDDVPDQASVVISRGFWKNRLAADPSIVGRTVWLDHAPFTVVGIADRSVSSPPREGRPVAIWITLSAYKDQYLRDSTARREAILRNLEARRAAGALSAGDSLRLDTLATELAAPLRSWNPAVEVRGRLKPGVPRDRAAAEVLALATSIAGPSARAPVVQLDPVVGPKEDSVAAFLILMIVMGLMVLLACANVTNLLLANAAGRRREIGTRLAIGATRGRIVRQLLTESLLVSVAAGGVGFAIAHALIPTLSVLMQVPDTFDVSPDPVAYAFVFMITIAAGLLAGLAPARYGRRGDLMSALAGDRLSSPGGPARTRVRSLLIGAQAAGSIVFLVLASLLARSLLQTLRQDFGFDPGRLMVVYVGTNSRWDAARAASYWDAALEQIRSLPGVNQASLASLPPFSGIYVARMPNGRWVNRNETSADYFSTIGIRVLQGRTYSAAEVRAEAPVAVISESLARKYWESESPIGASLERVWGISTGGMMDRVGFLRRPPEARIIGVVNDVTTMIKTPRAPTIYLPLISASLPRLVVRTYADPHVLAKPVVEALQRVDPSVEPRVSFSQDGLDRELEGPRTLAALAGLAGGIVLTLALIGLFGVTAFVVRHRTHEISVRRALGASQRDVVAMIVRESLRPVSIGLAIGVVLALLGGHTVQGVVYGVSARDPLAIGAAVVLSLAAAAAAAFVPARRAARVNPAELLKLQ